MRAKKHTMIEIKQWAEEYKKYFSFAKVARIFNANKHTVRDNLIKYKDKFNVQSLDECQRELAKSGRRRCITCCKIRPFSEFSLRTDTNKYKNQCMECVAKRSCVWRAKNDEKIKARRKKYHKENGKRINQKSREYYQLHKEDKLKYHKQYGKTHRKEINKYKSGRRKRDISFRLSDNLRSRLRLAIVQNQKSGSAVKDLGCSINELKQYLENQFYLRPTTKEEMTWDNYGLCGWHIDHIIPLSSFDLADRDQFLRACHYTNLQPLWAEDNFKKGNKTELKQTQGEKENDISR